MDDPLQSGRRGRSQIERLRLDMRDAEHDGDAWHEVGPVTPRPPGLERRRSRNRVVEYVAADCD